MDSANSKPTLIVDEENVAGWALLYSLMCWPDDIGKVEWQTRGALGHLYSSLEKELKPTQASVFQELRNSISSKLWPGFVAGHIMWHYMSCGSIGKARHLTIKSLNNQHIFGKRRTLSDTSVRKAWREHKTVAHLWAAMEMLKSDNKYKPVTLLKVAHVAQIVLADAEKRGLKIDQPHRTVVGKHPFQKLTLTYAPINDWAKDSLADYLPANLK